MCINMRRFSSQSSQRTQSLTAFYFKYLRLNVISHALICEMCIGSFFQKPWRESNRLILVHHDSKDMLAKRVYLNSKANKKYNTKMINKMITLDKVLEEAEHLEFDDREYLLNILSKRQIELRRVELSKRVKEALKAYKEGNVKSGNLEELWKDLND